MSSDSNQGTTPAPVQGSLQLPTPSNWSALHSAEQQARILGQVLQDDKQRIGYFFGAGCPLGIYDEQGSKSVELIPAVIALTTRVANALGAEYKKHWDKFVKECARDDGRAPTVEDILTELRTFSHRQGKAAVLEMNKEQLAQLDREICAAISKQLEPQLPDYRNSYNRFASWVAGVDRAFPVEVFTPNYDLLFEQAFEQQSLPHFDGFVGSREPWFDLAALEHDSLPVRWTRLWKLHGSINWELRGDAGKGTSRVVRMTDRAQRDKVMIYPSHLKYDQSRRMPYLAMIDRLRAFFHRGARNRHDGSRSLDDAPRLVVCGYSFLDQHINEVLLEGLRGNRNAQCFALMYSELKDSSAVVEYARKQGNLTVLAYDGAVVGTRVGYFKPATDGGAEHSPWLSYNQPVSGATNRDVTNCRLGDFHYFGLFLEKLCGGAHVAT